MTISFLALAILGLLVLSAFFSGSETAFFSLTKIQLKKIEKRKDVSSKRIIRLLKNPRELLIIILLGNTLVNVAASSAAALIAIELTDNVITNIPDGLVMSLQIIIMTLLLLLFGEISPKLLAYSSPEKFSKFSCFLLESIKYILWPLIKILDFISSIISRNNLHKEKSNITSEEFQNLLSSQATQTSLEESEKRIIAGIFRFPSTVTREIMTPRVDMIASEISEGLNNLKQTIIESGHSKIPIYRKNIDNIIGIVYAKDIILQPEKVTINSLLRPCLFITENYKIQNLLNQFKTKKIQIAIVVDEYGGTSGLITLEDILEELVGEIMDEYDTEQPMISNQGEKDFLVNGMFTINELNQRFNLDIDEEKYDNLAEFVYDCLNCVPRKNDKFIYGKKVEFTVSDIDGQRINYVGMRLLDEETP